MLSRNDFRHWVLCCWVKRCICYIIYIYILYIFFVHYYIWDVVLSWLAEISSWPSIILQSGSYSRQQWCCAPGVFCQLGNAPCIFAWKGAGPWVRHPEVWWPKKKKFLPTCPLSEDLKSWFHARQVHSQSTWGRAWESNIPCSQDWNVEQYCVVWDFLK